MKSIVNIDADKSNDTPEKWCCTKNVSFRSRTSKIRNLFLENAEDLDFVMQMHNLLEYIHSYFMTSRLLHNRYRDEIDNIGDDDDDDDVSNGKSFKYKTKITGTEERNICTRWWWWWFK